MPSRLNNTNNNKGIMMSQHRAATASVGWVLVLLILQACQECQGTITINEIDQDIFEIYLSGIKIFQHNETNPMMFVGEGRTDFEQSGGNFHVRDRLNSRIPLPYVTIYSNELPIDMELFFDFYHFARVEIHEDAQHALVLRVTEVGGHLDRLWLRMVAQPEEKVFGGGEQFTYLNLRGRSFPVWVSEQGVGRNKSTLTTFQADQKDGAGGDYHTTYFPQPTFVSTRGYYLHHDGPDYAILDFTQPEFHELYIMAERSNISNGRVVIQNGSDVTEMVRHLSDYLGRQPELPEWMHDGAILGLHGGTQKVKESVEQAEEYMVSISGVWIQDWTGTFTTAENAQHPVWNWQYDETLYSGLPTLISELQDRGIRLLGYINPHLHSDGSLFAVAEEHGYLVKNSSNQTFLFDFGHFYGGTVDLTNPMAFDWYKNDVIKANMIDLGLGGWMADMGEYVSVRGVSFHSGQSGEELHNLWPVLWARLNREAVEEAGKLGEVVFWMRSGFSGTSNYSTLMWAGDQNVDWSPSDGLPSTLTSALSLAMSGLTLTHFDIGGFTTFASFTPPLVRSEQLLLRSAELAVFTPVFRTHEGSEPSANVQYYSSRGTLLKFARLSRMFAAMKNYTRHVVTTSAQTGLPAQRPLFLNYPSDQASYDLPYQYMYGEDLLVAPVLQPDVTSHQVYLPPDPETPWVFLWDESMIVLGGRTVTVSAPLGQIPVFYRKISPFVSVFKAVASEPLVEAPPYIPNVPEGGSGSGSGPGCVVPPGDSGGSVSARSGFGCVFLLCLLGYFVSV